jgi:hypothetical protein
MKTIISARATAFVLGLFAFGLGLASAQTSNTCANPLNNGTYSKFSVVELGEYSQTNAGGAFVNGIESFAFEASISLATNLSASAATLTIPSGQPQTMSMSGTGEFIVLAITNAFSNVASAYPGGDYVFTVSNKMTTVHLPTGSTLPNAPALNNYDAAQAINPAQDFTLSWVPFSGGTSKDYIQVTVESQLNGTVFKSADFGCPGALDGAVTSLLVPSNTLASSQTFSARILFVKVLTLNTNSTPGVALLAGMETDMGTTISTGLGTNSPFVLTNAAVLPGGGVRFDLETTPGLFYEVDFNSDLTNPNGWTPLFFTNAAASLTSFTNPAPAGAGTGFYRALHF